MAGVLVVIATISNQVSYLESTYFTCKEKASGLE